MCVRIIFSFTQFSVRNCIVRSRYSRTVLPLISLNYSSVMHVTPSRRVPIFFVVQEFGVFVMR